MTTSRTRARAELATLETAWRDANVEELVAATQALTGHRCAGHDVDVPQIWWGTACRVRDAGRYDDAIASFTTAIETGYRSWPLPEADIAECLLRAGRRDDAADLYRELQTRAPGDVWLHNSAGFAYVDIGDDATALDWFTSGLELALATGDPERVVGQLHDARTATLTGLGYDPDALADAADAFLTDPWQPPARWRAPAYLGTPPLPPGPCSHCGWRPDSRAVTDPADIDDHPATTDGSTRRSPATVGAVAVAWFPPDVWPDALARWPHLPDELGVDPDDASYNRSVQGRLLRLRRHGIGPLHVAPFDLAGFEQWATNHHHDPASPDARAGYTAELAHTRTTISWPPRRNDPCWCRSGRKYKHCCATTPEEQD